jgi:hypothetical protein
MTALRCGAPFAFQRNEYAHCTPDFVIFGKALRVCGVGTNYDGPFLQSLGITSDWERLRMLFRWHDLQTRPLSTAKLIEASWTLSIAKEQQWPLRSKLIGKAIRSMIIDCEKSELGTNDNSEKPIKGLDALIYIEKERTEALLIMGSPKDGYLRLTPVLDDYLLDKELPEHVAGVQSRIMRQRVAVALKAQRKQPLWCYTCGDPTEGVLDPDLSWCESCCLSCCGESVCMEMFSGHKCLGLMEA